MLRFREAAKRAAPRDCKRCRTLGTVIDRLGKYHPSNLGLPNHGSGEIIALPWGVANTLCESGQGCRHWKALQENLKAPFREFSERAPDTPFESNPEVKPERADPQPDRPLAGFFDEDLGVRFKRLRDSRTIADLIEIEDLVDDGTGIRRIRVAEVLHQHNRLLEAFGLHFPTDFDPSTVTDSFTFTAVNEGLAYLVTFGRAQPVHLDQYKDEATVSRLESMVRRLVLARRVCNRGEDRLDRVDALKELLRMAGEVLSKPVTEGKVKITANALHDKYRGDLGPGLQFVKPA